MESLANKIYKLALKHIVNKMENNGTTFSSDLERTAKRMLGAKFLGVVPSDKIPKMADGTYIISNLDNSYQSGSHWISIVKDGKNLLVYDSFGRPGKRIIPSLIEKGNIIDTEDDAEQGKNEENCGQRSIASLFVYDQYGKDMFMLL